MKNKLPQNFRKLDIEERRRQLVLNYGLTPDDTRSIYGGKSWDELCDLMIESAIGIFPVPLGIATGFIINEKSYNIPMATEEPSVIAAASHGARIVSSGGGFKTWASDPIMTAQIYLQNVPKNHEKKILKETKVIEERINKLLPGLKKRGGGFRGIEVKRLSKTKLVRVHIHKDVRDAMGANMLNTAAEGIRELLEKISGGKSLMAILTNTSPKRLVGASFRIPIRYLKKGSISGKEAANRIELASKLAFEDPARAATHNKGILNGIVALTLATGNDTRGIEAAAHSYAVKKGHYSSLSTFIRKGGFLKGSLELPIPIGTVGGAIGLHPSSKASLKILRNPDALMLSQIAAALGLAQNLAAILALTGEGIQAGHMRLHASRVAYMAGARHRDVKSLAQKLVEVKNYSLTFAKEILKIMHGK